jgi:prepilin-type N-terminal cleavage/methylation domain-containing protein
VKRKGFTLIELMVVIAIIIILAAIAIPNYLKMTERAKKSRLQSDFATLATVLETFKTDWGAYPIVTSALPVITPGNRIFGELSGTVTGAVQNVVANTNAVGEKGPIEYLKAGTMTSMVNPFSSLLADAIQYLSDTDGINWVVYVDTKIALTPVMYRTDGSSTVSYCATVGAVPAP